MTADYMGAHIPGGYDGGAPFEGAMKKGDVLIWHHWCVAARGAAAAAVHSSCCGARGSCRGAKGCGYASRLDQLLEQL
jgi:hypothetical protein